MSFCHAAWNIASIAFYSGAAEEAVPRSALFFAKVIGNDWIVVFGQKISGYILDNITAFVGLLILFTIGTVIAILVNRSNSRLFQSE